MQPTNHHHYRRFLIMIAVSFAAMYVLMYAMVNSFDNVFNNLNQFYMAGVMAAAMAIIELLLMRAMYHSKKLNRVILAISVVALLGFWVGIRQQVAIGDTQFLRSMIPHHAGAILMCEQASIRDSGIKELCGNIITSQNEEIAQMKTMLRDSR